MTPPIIVLTLFGSLQITVFTALARPLSSCVIIPIRYESIKGDAMFIRAARMMYRPIARAAMGTRARLSMNAVESPWVVRIALSTPSLPEIRGLNTAAIAIVRLETARTGPLTVSDS